MKEQDIENPVIDFGQLWDKHSEAIGEDIDSLGEFAGTTVITSEQFWEMAAEMNRALLEMKRKAEALDKLQWLANRHNWATVFTTTLETRLYLEDGTGKLSYVAPDLLTAIEKAQAMKVK